MRRLNTRGLSMVAVIISISIVSIMGFAVINLIGISSEVLNIFNNSLRAMDAAQEVRFALTDAATCSHNLRSINLRLATDRVPQKLGRGLTYSDQRPILSIDNSEGEPLSLDGIFLRRSALPNLAYMDIKLRNKNESGELAPMPARSLPLWVQTNPAGFITCCTTLNMSACP